MITKRFYYLISFCLLNILASGQTVSPQVINSAGTSYSAPVSGMFISDNIGEPFTQPLGVGGNFIITQGFLQPFKSGKSTGSLQKNDVTCLDKNDGNISIALNVPASNYSVQYVWTPSSVCPLSNCSSIDSLKAGTYSVKVKIIFDPGTNLQIDSSIVLTTQIRDENGPCKVKVYNTVTANNDGANDYFEIENIDEFPGNRVSIYNRWGKKVFETTGYDNRTKKWPDSNDAGLVSSTYFYVIELNNVSNPLKGWVELIKN